MLHHHAALMASFLVAFAATFLLIRSNWGSMTVPFDNANETHPFYNLDDFETRYGYYAAESCQSVYGLWPGCLLATDNATWTAQTYGWLPYSADYNWREEDTKTVNCLLGLLVLRADRCSSAQGSECEIADGASKVLNIVSDHQLTEDALHALHNASTNLEGVKVNAAVEVKTPDGRQLGGVFLSFIDRNLMDGREPRRFAQVKVNFEGGEPC